MSTQQGRGWRGAGGGALCLGKKVEKKENLCGPVMTHASGIFKQNPCKTPIGHFNDSCGERCPGLGYLFFNSLFLSLNRNIQLRPGVFCHREGISQTEAFPRDQEVCFLFFYSRDSKA